MKYYSILLDIKGKRCTVIGGGKIALRKIEKLCRAGAIVTVVAPQIITEIKELHFSNIQFITESYKPQYLSNSFLVFAATSCTDTNETICKEAKEQGILVNSITQTNESNFIIPASCKKDFLNIGISTDGLVPSLSKQLRKHIQAQMDKIKTELLCELKELREQMINLSDEKDRKTLQDTIDFKVNKIIELIS